jgi:hypothetical protein
MRKRTERRLRVKRSARESRTLEGSFSELLHGRANEIEAELSNLRAAVLRIDFNMDTSDKVIGGALTTAKEAIERITEVAAALREQALFHPTSVN